MTRCGDTAQAAAMRVMYTTSSTNLFHSVTGGNVDRPGGPGRTTPLMAAAGGGHLLCTQQLLDWGAEASCNSPDGTTALMVAASGGHTQCVAALIKAGANVNSHDHSGMSAMMLAAAAGHVMVLRCLIRHKAALERLSFQVVCTCKAFCTQVCCLLKQVRVSREVPQDSSIIH